MVGKREKPEDIVLKLRRVEVLRIRPVWLALTYSAGQFHGMRSSRRFIL